MSKVFQGDLSTCRFYLIRQWLLSRNTTHEHYLDTRLAQLVGPESETHKTLYSLLNQLPADEWNACRIQFFLILHRKVLKPRISSTGNISFSTNVIPRIASSVQHGLVTSTFFHSVREFLTSYSPIAALLRLDQFRLRHPKLSFQKTCIALHILSVRLRPANHLK